LLKIVINKLTFIIKYSIILVIKLRSCIIMLKKGNQVHVLIMEQIDDVRTCLIHFESFVRAICTPETGFETLANLCKGVCGAEAVADKSLRRMIDSLGNASFLPSTRKDLISIATSCDLVANKCETFAQNVVFQRFLFPEEYATELLEIISIIHAQFELLEKSISKLFGEFGALLKDHSILDEIRRHESKIDIIEQGLYTKIFARDISLAERMQMTSFVELVCDISDIIENIADKIQIMLVTRKA